MEFGLGTEREERALAFVQFLVMIAGLPIAIPDFQMMRFGDSFDFVFSIVGLLFCIIWLTVGLFASTRFIYAPYPLVISFGRNELFYDSGRPGLAYLCKTFDDEASPIYQELFRRRKRWTIFRSEISTSPRAVRIDGDTIVICRRNENSEYVVHSPDLIRPVLLAAISDWIMAEPCGAPERAARRFQMSHSLSPAR